MASLETQIKASSSAAIMLIQSTYKPGDLPPDGYLAWHEWADVQRKAGIEQVECAECGLWKTPQELSDKTYTFKGMIKNCAVDISGPICTKCDTKANHQGE